MYSLTFNNFKPISEQIVDGLILKII